MGRNAKEAQLVPLFIGVDNFYQNCYFPSISFPHSSHQWWDRLGRHLKIIDQFTFGV